MSSLYRFGISLDKKLIGAFDTYVEREHYASRSEAIRDLIREKLVLKRVDENGSVAGALVMSYDSKFNAAALPASPDAADRSQPQLKAQLGMASLLNGMRLTPPVLPCNRPDRLAGKKLGIVPILRAGLGMVDGILQAISDEVEMNKPGRGIAFVVDVKGLVGMISLLKPQP